MPDGRQEFADLTRNIFGHVATQMKLYSVDSRHSMIITHVIKISGLPKHTCTLFKVLYFILAKFKNHTLVILFLSQILYKNTLLYDKIV